MTRRKPMAKIAIGPRGASDEPEKVHYRAAPGQNYVSTLCGWDGGSVADRDPDGAVDCRDCLAIVKYVRGAP